MEWIIILRSLIELIAQLQFTAQSVRADGDGIAWVQSGSRRPICLLYSYRQLWGGALMAISRPHRVS